MIVHFSAVVLLGALAWWLVKKCGLKVGHALACLLFGFYFHASSAGPPLGRALRHVAVFVSRLRV